MADKPSRALILYGYGLASLITPSHSHFHAFASKASCGFLALDHFSPSQGDEKIIRELAQLLDANEANEAVCSASEEKSCAVPSMKERFMGMRAAIVTSSPIVKSFGEKLGFTVMEIHSDDYAADELLRLLGFQEHKVVDKDYFDLVFVHIGSHVEESSKNDLNYANSLVGRILQVAQPWSEIASRLHLSLVMSYGALTADDPTLSLISVKGENNSDFQPLFPRQSYTLKGVLPRSGIRHHFPILVAQWQDAVTRKDMVQEFSFTDFRKNCGNLAIAADRFFYEIAFKLWKAPKYGA